MGGRPAAMPVLAAARRRMDLLLALAVGLELQIEVNLIDAPRTDMLVARAGMLGLAAAVGLRRRRPALAAALAIGAIILAERLAPAVDEGAPGPFFVALLVSFSVGAHAEGRQLAAGAGILLLGSVVAIRLDRPPGGLEDLLFAWTIVAGGPIMIGRLVRARMRLNQALRDRAAAVERTRAARAAGAVASERTRIAGELHHVVSAALASMVGEAATAERLAREEPGAAERSLASIEQTGRDALTQIRGLLGVLRREDEELALAPLPSLAHVSNLVARVRAAGLPVELEVFGKRAPLPSGVDLTAYRVVQEALGGALAAPDARAATVRLLYGAREVVLEVADAGAEPPGPERSLLGVHERVALYGGELLAEPRDPSGYAVTARLPLERAT